MDDASSLDSYDIESIVLLKDAAAAGMYGLRGANGIILINTKRGKEGKSKSVLIRKPLSRNRLVSLNIWMLINMVFCIMKLS